MMNIELGNPTKRFLAKCHPELYERLMERMQLLAVNPFPQDVKRVGGRKEKIFRVRMGDYRIQYVVLYAENVLLISDVDKRSRAYD